MICISKRHPIQIRYAIIKHNNDKDDNNDGDIYWTCDVVKSWIINLSHLHQGVNIHSTYSHLYHSQSKRCRKRRFVLIVNGMRCCVWICSKLGCWWTNRNTERIAKEVNYWVSGVKSGWYDQKQKTKTRLGRCLSYCYWEGVYFFLSRES